MSPCWAAGKVVKVDREGNASDWLTGLVSPVGLGIQAGRLYVSAYLDRTVRAYKLSDRSPDGHHGARQSAVFHFRACRSGGSNQESAYGVVGSSIPAQRGADRSRPS